MLPPARLHRDHISHYCERKLIRYPDHPTGRNYLVCIGLQGWRPSRNLISLLAVSPYRHTHARILRCKSSSGTSWSSLEARKNLSCIYITAIKAYSGGTTSPLYFPRSPNRSIAPLPMRPMNHGCIAGNGPRQRRTYDRSSGLNLSSFGVYRSTMEPLLAVRRVGLCHLAKFYKIQGLPGWLSPGFRACGAHC